MDKPGEAALPPEQSVFVCHSSKDRRFVIKLAAALAKRRIKTWLDTSEIAPGHSLLAKIEEGIDRSRFFGVVLSSNSVMSPWVQRELRVAISRDIAEGTYRVLPVLIDGCEIPAFVRDVRYADFRESFERGLYDLLRAVSPSTLLANLYVTPTPSSPIQAAREVAVELPGWLPVGAHEFMDRIGIFMARALLYHFQRPARPSTVSYGSMSCTQTGWQLLEDAIGELEESDKVSALMDGLATWFLSDLQALGLIELTDLDSECGQIVLLTGLGLNFPVERLGYTAHADGTFRITRTV